jgi:hypothetical protein
MIPKSILFKFILVILGHMYIINIFIESKQFQSLHFSKELCWIIYFQQKIRTQRGKALSDVKSNCIKKLALPHR